MSKRSAPRTYLDAGVLISAFGASGPLRPVAWPLATDPDRPFVTSDTLALEVFPQPIRNSRTAELRELDRFFKDAEINIGLSGPLFSSALDLACRFGLSAADALHVAAALEAKADEFVTIEKKSKAFGSVRLPGLKIIFLAARTPTP